MHTEKIIVSLLDDSADISISRVRAYHASCFPAQLQSQRDQTADQYVLACSCGFKLRIPQLGAAATKMLSIATAGGSASLASSEFVATPTATSIELSEA